MQLPAAEMEELEKLIEAHIDLGHHRFARALAEFSDRGSPELREAVGLADGKLFSRRAIALLSWSAGARYQRRRLHQLKEAGFQFWVFRVGSHLNPDPIHVSWDGLVLPSDHDFWLTRFPANSWTDTSHVAGTRSWAGVSRLRGDPDKQLPDGWDEIEPTSGLPPGVSPGFDSMDPPGLPARLEALVLGHLHQ